ncbi:MAG: threonine ammonia-lyase [Campylobacteraceae bacterium]|jgi:threonine dehydratase|nr:threonine ammonia-lyase [Campylobacteraceae bacterium]MBT3882912.1 threonine ammonia-lyase [Campylobacteraceae bacterium]MBT4030895.1 threonine ammonia-lyase [Campylobacteraceae bacterium]MBT4179232.1 threonine ammonia-lyase [Campylobacteraceae bacterium]MBT4572850.1 threonine ammonia-lyase [Campylobacteraceae bacterium]
MINLENITKARNNIEGVAYNTPLTYAPILSNNLDTSIYLKKENLQLTGSFKLRGAFNKIATLTVEEKSKGVVAASAGNHAQGVGFSAKYFGCDATIVMPEATPLTKVNGVKSHGADVILHGSNYDEAYAFALDYTSKNNKTFVHPFEDDEVICGQGTIALEILEELEDIDMIIIPIGGGGLVSGIAAAIKEIKPEIQIIGVVSSGAKSMKDSYEQKVAIDSISVKTIADGIAVRDTSLKMLDLVIKYVDKIVEVNDQEIASAILFLLEQQKLVVEGAGAVGVAAMMHKKIDISGKKVVSILSGGNIDVTMLSQIIEKGLVKTSRKMNLIVTLIDKPGSLMTLTNIFKENSANIVQIDYDRDSVQLDFGDANVTISLETKGEEHQKLLSEQLIKYGYRFKQL